MDKAQSLPVVEQVFSHGKLLQIRRRLLFWGKVHYKLFPWRSPHRLWHGLIAEVLLSRTWARNVVPVYTDFTARFPEAESLKAVTLEEIEILVYPLGLRRRAPLLKQLCDYLAKANGHLPTSLQDLQLLPGVGTYVAAAMLSLHMGKRAVLLDTNVVRFICRLIDYPVVAELRRKRWMLDCADALTPHREVREFNYALLDFTMEICVTKPKCKECPIGPTLCLHGAKVLRNKSDLGHSKETGRIQQE